jgi:asparagine synthase (glutamine-hydrolysing)
VEGAESMLDEGSTFSRLDAAWLHALEALAPDEPLVVLFSGGVDSGLLAWELRTRAELRLTTVGLAGSADLSAAGGGARLLGLPWDASVVAPDDVQRMARQVAEWEGPLTLTERSIETALALAVGRAPRGALVCGQGADELFLGYSHYRGLDPSAAAQRADQDLRQLQQVAWPRSERVARRLGRELRAPYLDPEFVAVVRSIPVEARLPGDRPKGLLRRWALHRGLPALVAERPKKALQYGSGVERALRVPLAPRVAPSEATVRGPSRGGSGRGRGTLDT